MRTSVSRSVGEGSKGLQMPAKCLGNVPDLLFPHPASTQHLNRGVPVDQFAAFGLSKTYLDLGGDGLTLFEHPVLKIELLANDLKSLIENLSWVLIRARPHRQIDYALLFGFQVNRHGRTS